MEAKERIKEVLKSKIRDVEDFPKPGILFKDITTLLQDGDAFKNSVDLYVDIIRPLNPDKIVAVEARGFIFGGAVAKDLGCGFVPVRKPGKLPYKTKSVTYKLEYGEDTLTVHEDAIAQGEKVVIVDDLLATGGTVEAVTELVGSMGAEILGVVFLIELGFLNGREKLKDYSVDSIISF